MSGSSGTPPAARTRSPDAGAVPMQFHAVHAQRTLRVQRAKTLDRSDRNAASPAEGSSTRSVGVRIAHSAARLAVIASGVKNAPRAFRKTGVSSGVARALGTDGRHETHLPILRQRRPCARATQAGDPAPFTSGAFRDPRYRRGATFSAPPDSGTP